MNHYEKQILAALDAVGGLLTGDVANRCKPLIGGSRQKHSAYIRQLLLALQAEGKVKTLDDQKPVCWIISKDTNDNP